MLQILNTKSNKKDIGFLGHQNYIDEFGDGSE
jgi:hypothetical protein